MVSTVVIFAPLLLVDFVNFFGSRQAVFKNVGLQVKRMRVSLAAWLDPQFWRWAAWFWLNSLMPGWADFNHQSHRCFFLLAPELIQSSLASWQFDSNQFHALFIYLGCSPSTAYNARKKRRGGWEIGSAVEKPPWRL